MYENRFVYHLIHRLFAFVDKRTDVIFWSTGDETCNTMCMESKIDDAYEEISYKMEPTYATDTLLVVKKTDPKEIMEGDVISFYSTDPALEGAVNTHRVVSISQDGDSYIYTTKGDANNAADLYDAQSRYLIGKVIWSSLFLGKLSRLAANPLIFIPLILIPLAAILITNLVHTVRLAKTIAKEEEEAAVKEAIQALRAEREQKK